MFDFLENISDLEFNSCADLSRYSTMRLQCQSPLAIAKSIEAVKKFVQACQKNKQEYRLLGRGANQLLVDAASFIYLHLELPFDVQLLAQQRERYRFPASLSLAKLTAHAAKYSLKGWEVFTGIPASLGGAIYMNAGTNLGEIANVVDKVGLVDSKGQEREEIIKPDSFSYRHNNFCQPGEVIIWVEMHHNGVDESVSTTIKDYLKLRNETQPLAQATCGCMFKNAQINGMTCRAGLSLDIIGLKGLNFGGVRVSHKHANFMENVANASRNNVLELTQLVQDELKLTLGVDFELEVDTGERKL